jgi:pimeloyl-ACP methyl ester carboxylesterase
VPTIEANGQELYYEVHGEGEPLLCVHGLAADTLSWALQVPAFSERYRTVVFDNRDVGRSSMASQPYDVVDMARDAFGVADGLGLDGFHLLGVSLGGAIAQEMALAAPGRIRTVTLAASWAGGGAYARETSRVWALRARRLSREEHVDSLMLLTLSEAFYENEDAVSFVRNMILQHPYPQPVEGFVRQVEASGRFDARERVPSMSLPVHVIGAEHDILIPVWKSRELAELIPGARFTVIERAPHGMTLERAEEFNRAVLEFLAETSPAPV